MQQIVRLLTRVFIASSIAGGLGLTIWTLLKVSGVL